MGSKGRYKYICEECDAENWLSARERSSHFKPRCVECGSLWLVPSKASKGPEKLADKNDAFREQKDIQDKKMNK